MHCAFVCDHKSRFDSRQHVSVELKNMKLEEMYDYDFKSASKTHQSILFGRNMTKVKNLLFVVGLLLICTGFYYVGSKSVDQQLTK